jgi:cytochrome c oxidase cbb3-type subunit III
MLGTFNGMNFLQSALHWSARLAALFLVGLAVSAAQTPTQTRTPSQTAPTPSGARKASALAPKSYPPALVESGSALFRKDCSFCHGRDAGGGETGPDLTRSKLVAADVSGSKIGEVVRSGRPDKGMPHFDLSAQQIAGLAAFIHTQRNIALAQKGGRKGVDVSDLQTGNAEAGKQYFDGAGGCANCHSPSGDLAGIASRRQGLELEMWMLYPERAKSKVTVTLASGQTINGALAYRDEFTIALMDATGVYRSWRTSDVQYKLDAPVDAHVDLLSKYTDADIHNLMAYLQTLR